MKKTTIVQFTHAPQSLFYFNFKMISQIKLIFYFTAISLLLFNSQQSYAQADQREENPSVTTSNIALSTTTSVVEIQQQLKLLRAERAVFQRALKKATALQRQEQIRLLQEQLDEIDAKTKASLKIIYRLPESE